MKGSFIERSSKALDAYKKGIGGAVTSAVKSGYQILNFQETFGIPRIYTVHIWNNLLIFDAISKFLLLGIETQIFGHNWTNKGVISTYAQTLPVIMIAAMYFYFLAARKERPFILETLYKFHVIFMIIVGMAYFADAWLFYYDKTTFCKLQSEYKRDKCDERNKYFLWQAGLFFFFWLPIWWGAASAHKRLSKELKDA